VEVMEAAVLEGHPEMVSRGSVVAVAMDLVEMEVEATAAAATAAERVGAATAEATLAAAAVQRCAPLPG
jgi:hypothetical protein